MLIHVTIWVHVKVHWMKEVRWERAQAEWFYLHKNLDHTNQVIMTEADQSFQDMGSKREELSWGIENLLELMLMKVEPCEL